MESAGGNATASLRAPAGPQMFLADMLDRLEAEAPELAERMLRHYLDSIPSYRALSDETLHEISEVNLRNIYGFVTALRESRGPRPDEMDILRTSARKRAREGVPLSGMLAAYRMGGQLAWDEALRLVGDDPDMMRAGLEFATALMKWIDEASGAAANAYLAEYERLATDREAARRDFIDGALGGALTADEILARAEALGLDPHEPHVVALVEPAGVPEPEAVLRAVNHRLRSTARDIPRAERSFGVARGNELLILFPAADGDEEEVARSIFALLERTTPALGVELRAGVGRARPSLAEIAGSYREAALALTAARAGSTAPVVVYGEVLVEELILRERGVARRLAQAVLDPLERHPELRETLVQYIAHGPSLPAVAKRLYLHPNTVAYRLSRIRELTGRDPKNPAGIAELVLALRAAQLVGSDPA